MFLDIQQDLSRVYTESTSLQVERICPKRGRSLEIPPILRSIIDSITFVTPSILRDVSSNLWLKRIS